MAQLGSTTVYGDLIVNGNIRSSAFSVKSPVVFDVATSSQTNATNKIVWNTIYVNKGSGYNSTTGRFTAPIKGVYMFYTAFIKVGPSTTITQVEIRKNGVASNGGRRKRLSEVGGFGDNGVGSWLIELDVGDYVEVWITAGGTYNTVEYDIFTGFLLN